MRRAIATAILGILLLMHAGTPARADVFGSIGGTVYDPNGKPLPDVVIMLEAPDSAPVHATTDQNGRFRFAQVPFDTYTVTAESSAYSGAAQVVTIASGTNATVVFHLTAKTLAKIVTRGTSVTASGQPVSVNVINNRAITVLPNNSSLASVVQTVPGIVPFSYNEPVSRGFHGITYAIDGISMPQTAGSYFSEIVDPRDIGRMEIMTGSFPAEFGGQRQGGVVNILTRSPHDVTGPDTGFVSLYGGSYSTGGVTLNQVFGGGDFRGFLGGNVFRSSRGLDSPTSTPDNDATNQNDGFARLIFSPSSQDTLSADYAVQYANFQIPINTNQHDPNDPNWSVPGTDDNQKEYARFANFSWNRVSKDGQTYFQLSPWWASGRIQYLPDPAADLAGASQSSTFQDRYSNFLGLAALYARSGEKQTFKAGLQTNIQNAQGQFEVQFIDPTTSALKMFTDDSAQRGSNFGLYVEDKYNLTNYVTINAGVRYDHSTGYTNGHQISPRFEVNLQADPDDVVHLYFGRLYAAPLLEDVRRSAVIIGGGSSSALPVYDLRPERDSIYEGGVAHTFTPMINASVNLWYRNVTDVLDTTQIGSTPLFTLFNSAYGRAMGMEFRLQGHTYYGNSYYLSYGASLSQAYGISGGTFLFPVSQLQGANSWALEDHDQTNTINAAYTFNLAGGKSYATLQTIYGSGFPVQFENGAGRLPVHWEIGASYGQPATRHSLGWEIDGNNLLNHIYLIKVANGFNSTQYAQGRSIVLKLTAPIP
jgi:outer membrane receptor for ferrienterochelin and colicin